jgi:hypothetical protein
MSAIPTADYPSSKGMFLRCKFQPFYLMLFGKGPSREHINNTPSISAKKYAHPDYKDALGGAYLLAERCAR